LFGKPEGKSLLGRLRRRYEDKFKKYFQDIETAGIIWIDLAQDKKN
jgi:hypothetical protein